MTAAIVLDGFHLRVDGDEPRVRDLDLAERAGLAKPRNVRQVIKAAAEDGALNIARTAGGVREVKTGPVAWLEPETITAGNGAERDGEAFYLNEEAALVVLTRLRTKTAVAVTRALVSVFVTVRRGEPVTPPTVSPAPNALETYREVVVALERAKAAGAIDDRGLALRQASLLKAHLGVDIFAAPLEGFAALPDVAELAPGESVTITKNVDTTGHYTASALGAPYGLSGRAVGDLARAEGIFKMPGWGKSVAQTRADGKRLDDAWLYNEQAKARLTPRFEAERDRRASKQLPLGKRGAS